MGLDSKELELAAISISIAAGCLPCTRHHLAEAENEGASHEERTAAIVAGAHVADRALVNVWAAFDERAAREARIGSHDSADRQSLLGSIGAAVATNSVRQLRTFVKAAQSMGVTDTEILAIVGLAARIKEKAASHLDTVIDGLDGDRAIAREAGRLCT